MEIRPIRDLRDTTAISELCNSRQEPVFITKNGYGDLVVMSLPVYNQMLGRAELYRKIEEGLADIEAGRTVDGPTAMAQIRERLENHGK